MSCMKTTIDSVAHVSYDSSLKSDLYVLCITRGGQECADTADVIAASGSDNTIKVLHADTLQTHNQVTIESTGQISGTITDLQLSEHCILWSASTDGNIRSWDMRKATEKPVCVLQGYNHEPFNCMTLQSGGSRLLVGGSDKVGEDASIYIWDIRMGREVLAVFTESHSDDITQVVFNTHLHHQLLSGSTDGLVCVFDLATLQEEDALLEVKNSNSSVAKIGFFGSKSNRIFCLTHQESLLCWDSLEEPQPVFNQTKIRESLKDECSVEVDYFVDCFYGRDCDKLHLVGGDNSGGLRTLHCSAKTVAPVTLLRGGHSSVVRCMSFDPADNSLVTGGEDGTLCLWKNIVPG